MKHTTFDQSGMLTHLACLVYVVYWVIYNSGQVTLRQPLVLWPSPERNLFEPTNPESINQCEIGIGPVWYRRYLGVQQAGVRA